MATGWDNNALKKLKALVGRGLSTSEIGKRLGMSKNAIVGKLNRLGWNAKAGADADNKKTPQKAKTTDAKKTSAKKTTAKVVSGTKKTTSMTKPAKKTPAKVATKKTAKVETKTTAKVKTETKPKEPRASRSSTSKTLAMHQRIIQHSLELASLKPNQCRWPIGDPDSENFHFCGKQVFTGKPYCYEHCRLAYQFTPPKKK